MVVDILEANYNFILKRKEKMLSTENFRSIGQMYCQFNPNGKFCLSCSSAKH